MLIEERYGKCMNECEVNEKISIIVPVYNVKKKLDELDYDLNLDRGSIAAYARLFIGTMLSDEVGKVLYLDSDTLIKESLKELYDTDITPYFVGGIRDSFSTLNKKAFGIKKGGLFINSGVMLINLQRWRQRRVENEIYNLLKNKESIFQGDQGIINFILHGDAYELPLKYDVMTYLYDFTYEEMMLYRKPDNYFDKDEVEATRNEPAIVHFSSSFASRRPWEKGQCSPHPFGDEWREYFVITGGNYVKSTRRVHSFNRLKLWMIGVLHAYIRPLMYLGS